MSTAQDAAHANQNDPTNGEIYVHNDIVTQHSGLVSRVVTFIRRESNFFRLHLTAFVFIPLIASGIFYGSNGQYPVEYLDSLFLCYSAMSDTGLSTVNLSQLTGWQQTILYLLMGLGDITLVAWVMVLIRKYYYKSTFEHLFTSHRERLRNAIRDRISAPKDRRKMGTPVPERIIIREPTPKTTLDETRSVNSRIHQETRSMRSMRARTVSWVDRGVIPEQDELVSSPHSETAPQNSGSPVLVNDVTSPISTQALRQRRRLTYDQSDARGYPRPQMTIISSSNAPISPHEHTFPPHVHQHTNKYRGLGDFPGPIQLFRALLARMFPSTATKLKRTFTIPAVATLEQKSEKWLPFEGLVVGRNSDFRTDTLTDEQLEELGGVEYRALRLLSYLVPAYFVFVQLLGFLIFGPWLLSISTYNHVFENQYRYVPKGWYSVFILMSIKTGTGLDLCDTAMIPFQTAYPMIFSLLFLLLAGNHAQAIFLRLIIWTWSRLVRENSELDKTLSFLLKHPRRCFLYLFPSHQTWFLTIVLVALSVIEWISFPVLNLGLEYFESLPTGTKYIAGLFQGIAVRASGLAIVSIGSLSPACTFLYIVLMYIAVYPVAMCIRATNVYEEHSLGIFSVEEGDLTEDLDKLEPTERIGKYVGWHLRHQLSNDIWWLVWGIFLICVIERSNIMDPEKTWFNLFAIIFELVSAFAGIGLSLGVPDDNYSFSGRFRKLSKLVVIVLMIRGRHRGLPVAVDRAVMLPREFKHLVPQNGSEPVNQEPTAQQQEKEAAGV